MTGIITGWMAEKDYGFADPEDGEGQIYFRRQVLPGGICCFGDVSLRGWRISGQVVANVSEDRQRRSYRVAWLVPLDGNMWRPTGRPAVPLRDEQVTAVSAQLAHFGGQAWLHALWDTCGRIEARALAGDLYVFGEANDLVVQLPGFDLQGRRGHGADAPRWNPGDTGGGACKGKGGWAASWSSPHGKGQAALPALGFGSPTGAQGAPLWQTQGWLEPGTWDEGRVVAFRDQPSAGAKSAAGWIGMDDGGPDVYFQPKQLDPTLADLLSHDDLLHTRVGVRVFYRDNGHHRYARGTVQFVGDGQGGFGPPGKGGKGAA